LPDNKQIENSEIPAKVSPFFETNWAPAPYRQLKDNKHQIALQGRGYLVFKDFFNPETISQLNHLHSLHKHEGANDIGMFMSAYSSDVAYRKEIHRAIGGIIETELDKIFSQYKPILYNFVIKESRPSHSLDLHQDMALIDENKSSSINVWICTMDTGIENGPVHLVPKTQYIFPPFRSLYTEIDIADVQETFLKYALPVCLKQGDLLIFDSRLIHGSLPNTSGKDRVAVVGHICPDDAQFTMVINSPGSNEDFDLVHFEREDLFQAKGFESSEKSEFDGANRTKIDLNRIPIKTKQLEAYFAVLQVPVINQSRTKEESNDTTPPSEGKRGFMKRLIARLKG
jgi:hypothetical protein